MFFVKIAIKLRRMCSHTPISPSSNLANHVRSKCHNLSLRRFCLFAAFRKQGPVSDDETGSEAMIMIPRPAALGLASKALQFAFS